MNLRDRYSGSTSKETYNLLIDTLHFGQVRTLIDDIWTRMKEGPFYQLLYERLARDLDVLNEIAEERGQNP